MFADPDENSEKRDEKRKIEQRMEFPRPLETKRSISRHVANKREMMPGQLSEPFYLRTCEKDEDLLLFMIHKFKKKQKNLFLVRNVISTKKLRDKPEGSEPFHRECHRLIPQLSHDQKKTRLENLVSKIQSEKQEELLFNIEIMKCEAWGSENKLNIPISSSITISCFAVLVMHSGEIFVRPLGPAIITLTTGQNSEDVKNALLVKHATIDYGDQKKVERMFFAVEAERWSPLLFCHSNKMTVVSAQGQFHRIPIKTDTNCLLEGRCGAILLFDKSKEIDERNIGLKNIALADEDEALFRHPKCKWKNNPNILMALHNMEVSDKPLLSVYFSFAPIEKNKNELALPQKITPTTSKKYKCPIRGIEFPTYNSLFNNAFARFPCFLMFTDKKENIEVHSVGSFFEENSVSVATNFSYKLNNCRVYNFKMNEMHTNGPLPKSYLERPFLASKSYTYCKKTKCRTVGKLPWDKTLLKWIYAPHGIPDNRPHIKIFPFKSRVTKSETIEHNRMLALMMEHKMHLQEEDRVLSPESELLVNNVQQNGIDFLAGLVPVFSGNEERFELEKRYTMYFQFYLAEKRIRPALYAAELLLEILTGFMKKKYHAIFSNGLEEQYLRHLRYAKYTRSDWNVATDSRSMETFVDSHEKYRQEVEEREFRQNMSDNNVNDAVALLIEDVTNSNHIEQGDDQIEQGDETEALMNEVPERETSPMESLETLEDAPNMTQQANDDALSPIEELERSPPAPFELDIDLLGEYKPPINGVKKRARELSAENEILGDEEAPVVKKYRTTEKTLVKSNVSELVNIKMTDMGEAPVAEKDSSLMKKKLNANEDVSGLEKLNNIEDSTSDEELLWEICFE